LGFLMAREPIGEKLPRIGRARDLDVEFLELFADIAASLAAIRVVLTSNPQFTEAAAKALKEREDMVVNRFERIIAGLAKED
jgi:hypothetical protein